jgi:Fuc2NAc and GlcNAc transferase
MADAMTFLPGNWVTYSLSLLGLVFLAAAVTGFARRYALKRAILDVPNERSSHTTPTPRGGGVALFAVWVLALVVVRPDIGETGTGLLLGSAVVVIAGWLGDQDGVGVVPRLILQLLAALLLIQSLHSDHALPFETFELGLALGALVAVIGLVWFINLYNFMDGVDGLAGVQAVIAGCAQGILFRWAGDAQLAWLSFGLAAGAAGFLLWNWPPAKIFLGDVGSGLLGFCFGGLTLAGVARTGLPVILLLLPLGVFVADATWTLVRRLWAGERVYEAHRTHLYQRLVSAGWSHGAVSSTAAGIAVVLSTLAWIGRGGSGMTVWAASLAMLGLVGTGVVLDRATRKARA